MGRPFFARTLPLFIATLTACAGHAARHVPDGPPVAVGVATAREEPLAVLYRASGTVRGRNTAVLTSKTTGYVREVRVHPGDLVTAGQPLVDLEANDARAGVARARASLERSTEAKAEAENGLQAARVAAKIAKTTLDRVGVLLKDGALPQQQYDDAEARWQGAVAQEQMAQARVRVVTSGIDESRGALSEAQATLGYSQIAAPFTGRVIERHVDPGALASPGTPLVVIADDGIPRVEAAVDESRADQVKIGDEATIEVDALVQPLVGRVSEIVPNVDVSSHAFLVKVDLPAEGVGLRPGTFARVGLRMGTRQRLVVPTTAITSFGALDRVFVVDGSRARLRMVTRGDAQGHLTEVLSGLSPGESVVPAPPADLRDGSPVEVRR